MKHEFQFFTKMEGQHFNLNISEYFKSIVHLIRIFVYHIGWAIARFSSSHIDTYNCLVGKTAIITGGSSGLGYATAMMMASRGCKIIIATNVDCEAEKKKLVESLNNPNIITKHLDLSSFDSIRRFVENIKKTESKIDFLVNNAGVGVIKQLVSKDGLNNVMQINYFGHFLLTHLLIDELKASDSARVVFVASSGAYSHKVDVDELNQLPENNRQTTSDEFFCYYNNSKFCVIIAAQELKKPLRKHGIKVYSVDPGIMRTNIVHDVLVNDAPRAWVFKLLFHSLLTLYRTDTCNGAKNTMYVLTGENINNGDHYFQCKPIFKPHYADNPEFCRKLWEKSEAIVKLRPEEKLV